MFCAGKWPCGGWGRRWSSCHILPCVRHSGRSLQASVNLSYSLFWHSVRQTHWSITCVDVCSVVRVLIHKEVCSSLIYTSFGSSFSIFLCHFMSFGELMLFPFLFLSLAVPFWQSTRAKQLLLNKTYIYRYSSVSHDIFPIFCSWHWNVISALVYVKPHRSQFWRKNCFVFHWPLVSLRGSLEYLILIGQSRNSAVTMTWNCISDSCPWQPVSNFPLRSLASFMIKNSNQYFMYLFGESASHCH